MLDLVILCSFVTEDPVSLSWGWASGEPNGWLGYENRIEFRFNDVYGFNDVGEDKKNAYICEIKLNKKDPGEAL